MHFKMGRHNVSPPMALEGDQKKTNNALSKHHEMMHPGLEPEFTSRPVKGNIKFNLDRFILEAHKIEQTNQNPNLNVMNSRSKLENRDGK